MWIPILKLAFYLYVSWFAISGLYLHPEPVIKTYGLLEYVQSDSHIEVDLASCQNYQELYQQIEMIFCEWGMPVIEIGTRKLRKRILLIGKCPGEIWCYKMRNVLEVKNDSIIKGNMAYPMDSLRDIMFRHYHNPKRSYQYSEHPQKAFIQICYDHGIETLPVLLDEITDAFDEIDAESVLLIQMVKQRRLRPPPLPPTPESPAR